MFTKNNEKVKELLVSILSNPNRFEDIVSSNWAQITTSAAQEIQKIVIQRRKTRMTTIDIPLPDKETEVAQLNALFVPYGMLASGVWVNKALHTDNTRTVFIHWPRLLGSLVLFPTYSPIPLPNVLLMVWGFNEIFRRRNMVYYEFFRRRLLRALAAAVPDKDYLGDTVPELNVHEGKVMAEVSKDVLDASDPMIQSLRQSFATTLEKSSALLNHKHPREELKDFFPSIIQGSSVWKTEMFLRRNDIILEKIPAPVIHLTRSPLFSPNCKEPWLRELIFARAVPANERSYFGVKRSLRVAPAQKITLVDMGQFAEYRTGIGIDLYNNFRKRRMALHKTWRQVASDLVFYFQNKLKGLSAPGANYEPFFAFVEHVFPEAKLDDILFIPFKAMKDSYDRYVRIEPARQTRTYGIRQRGPIRPAIIDSGPVYTAREKTFRFELILRRNKVYFHPPWDIPMVDIMAPASQRREFRSGVYFDRVNNAPYCTFEFLLGLTDSPLKKHPALYTLLRDHSKLSYERYAELLKASKRMFVEARERKEGHRFPYTQEEDLIIRKLYRPGMTAAHKAEILAVCKGRSWSTIVARASKICLRMLNYGCINLEDLPTINYNARIRRMIKRNKEKANVD